MWAPLALLWLTALFGFLAVRLVGVALLRDRPRSSWAFGASSAAVLPLTARAPAPRSVRLPSAVVAVVASSATGSALAQTAATPECPASASCVVLLLPSAFSLSAEDGALLGGAIVGVWAAAFAFRAAIRALRADEPVAED